MFPISECTNEPASNGRTDGKSRDGVRFGVYFMADDKVIDQVIAFLNSVRCHNPSVSLCLIPFSDDIAALRGLADRYSFAIFHENSWLARCDQVSAALHGSVVHHYRKLAAWYGVFDRFIYIDIDTIILGDITFVCDLLTQYDVITSHSDLPAATRWTWRAKAFKEPMLSECNLGFAANTGFLASRTSAIKWEVIEQAAERARAVRQYMSLECKEQPFLNFVITTSGLRYVSLLVLASMFAERGVTGLIPTEFWAGIRGAIVKEGRLYPPGIRPPVLLVHWAGQWLPTRVDRAVNWLNRTIRGHVPACPRRALPYKELWLFYRNHEASCASKNAMSLQ